MKEIREREASMQNMLGDEEAEAERFSRGVSMTFVDSQQSKSGRGSSSKHDDKSPTDQEYQQSLEITNEPITEVDDELSQEESQLQGP